MAINIQVPFQQLLKIVKSLSPAQKERLRRELIQENYSEKGKDEFIEYLLNGPIYSEKEIEVIEDNRKSISSWRTKS